MMHEGAASASLPPKPVEDGRKRPYGGKGSRAGIVPLGAALALAFTLFAASFVFATRTTLAQIAVEPGVQVPGFWDPRRRPERPDLVRVVGIRFLTEIDYPPFNFAGPDGNPQGFNVDLARMLCEELKLACTIQMRRFETLISSLNENRGDAVIASIAVTPDARTKADFTDPYYRTPGRFVARRDS